MKNMMKLAALGVVSMICLSAPGLAAWERTAMRDCKKASENCTKDDARCKKDYENCKKNSMQEDRASFENALSPSSRSAFAMFSDKKKKAAMDKADGTRMSPDDAVAKVARD